MDGRFREWLAGLGRREMAILALVGLAVLGGAAVWFVRSLPRAVTIESTPGTIEPTAGPASTPAPILVHVAGWVRRPGVYELSIGDRVIDAVERAGGARRDADLDALNLAALLVDGQQVIVPRRGEPASAGASGSGGPTAGAAQKINVNLATAAELETLPGIGPVLAQRIVEYREQNGPFASVDDLLEVSGIGEKTLDGFRDLVTV